MYRLDPSIVPRSIPCGFHLAHVSDIPGRKTGSGESEAYIELIDRNTLPWLTMRLSLDQAYNRGEIFGGRDMWNLYVNTHIYNLAFRTASAAQPVPLIPVYPNSTYHLDFYGPAVRCTASTNTSFVREISIENNENMSQGLQYMCWAGTLQDYLEHGQQEYRLSMSKEEARLTIVTTIGTWDRYYNYSSPFSPAREVNVTECVLHNVTYSVDFEFNYPNQSHKVSISSWRNTTGIVEMPDDERKAGIVSYLAVMDAFGKMLVGNATNDPRYGQVNDHLTSWKMMNIDWSDGEATRSGLESLFQNIT